MAQASQALDGAKTAMKGVDKKIEQMDAFIAAVANGTKPSAIKSLASFIPNKVGDGPIKQNGVIV